MVNTGTSDIFDFELTCSAILIGNFKTYSESEHTIHVSYLSWANPQNMAGQILCMLNLKFE